MGEFFEPPAPLPPPEPEPEWEPKPWWGPPTNVLPASLDLRVVLARTEDAVITLEHFDVFPQGVAFDLIVRARTDEAGEAWGDDFGPRRRGGESEGIPPELLRFGVEFPDGSKSTNLEHRFGPVEDAPEPPLLTQHQGGGSSRHSSQVFWLWPVPPLGKIAFVCEWPARGVDLIRVEIDGQLFADAALRAEQLWPRGSVGGRGWAMIGHAVARKDDEEDQKE